MAGPIDTSPRLTNYEFAPCNYNTLRVSSDASTREIHDELEACNVMLALEVAALDAPAKKTHRSEHAPRAAAIYDRILALQDELSARNNRI